MKNKMFKRVLACILVLIMLLGIVPMISSTAVNVDTVNTATSVLDGFEYVIEDCEITITGYVGSDTSVIIPSEIGGYPVKRIGDDAFENNTSLVRVTLPDSVSYIGDHAFAYCTSLSEIDFGSGLKHIDRRAFIDCESLVSVDLPYGLSTIEIGAFEDCKSLSEITLPDTVTSICYEAFLGTAYYKNPYNWENGVLYICNALIDVNSSFNQVSYSVRKGTSVIAEYAFSGRDSLKNIILPEGMTNIGHGAFNNANTIENISIPSSIVSVGDACFQDTAFYANESNWENEALYIGSLLVSVKPTVSGSFDVKSGTRIIAAGAFLYCEDIENINIPSTVTSIEYAAFYGCCALQSVNIPWGVTKIGWGTFSWCESLKSITIPSSVISVEEEAFVGCVSLANVELAEGIKVINESAFGMCISLKSVIIPESVETIGSGAFGVCEGLTSITIPKSVKTIRSYAFGECTNLEVVYYGGTEKQWNEIYIGIENECLTNAKVRYNYETDQNKPNKVVFSPQKDGWSFVNNREGFDYSNKYFIPPERYASVFGDEYVAAATNKNGTFNSMIPNDWGGNCYGMSVTSVMFSLGMLDWSKYNALYENDFSTVNSYYSTQRKDIEDFSFEKRAYVSSDVDTPITILIEKYFILQNGDTIGYKGLSNSTSGMVNSDFRVAYVDDNGMIKYKHNPEGDYIDTVYNTIVNSDGPLLIDIHGKGVHTIVTRTDKPPVDCGNGWIRVYVYDPNRPYLSDKTLSDEFPIKSYYLNNDSDDTYIELNIDQNKWRYTGAVNASETSTYWGCDYYGNFEEDNPDFLYVYDIDFDGFPTELNGTEPWKNRWNYEGKETSAIAVTGNSNIKVLSEAGELLVDFKDGYASIYDEVIEYYPYSGYVEGGNGSNGGKLRLPYTDYKINYVSGDDISVIGADSVISFACEGSATLSVSTIDNTVSVLSTDGNDIIAQVTDVSFDEGYSSASVYGNLKDGDSISLSLNDDVLIVNEDIKSDASVDVYADNDGFNEHTYVTTLDKSDDSIIVSDVRDTDAFDKPADNNGVKLLGDANGDGKVNVKDATHIQKAVAGIVTLSTAEQSVADVDSNGKVNVRDATAVQKWVAGIETGFPIGR